jgi:hypothetical protein
VILVDDVVRLSQKITSIAEKSTIQAYQIPSFFASSQNCLAQRFYLNSTAPGAKICSSSATNVSVGVTR